MEQVTSFAELLNTVSSMADTLVQSLQKVNAKDVGLDSRCGTLWVDTEQEQVIIRSHNLSTFNYYGGFEYTTDGCSSEVGGYVVFDAYNDESGRIQRIVEMVVEGV